MAKESKYSPVPIPVVRLPMTGVEEMLAETGVTTAVTFLNGIGTFNGSSSKVVFGKTYSGIKSIRIKFKPSSTTQNILKLTSSHSISASSGTLSATGVSSPTIYVNGSVSSTITTGWNDVVVTTATGITVNALTIGYITSYLAGDVEIVEMWGSVLTANEITNLWNQSRYKQFSPHGLIGATNNATPILNVNAFLGSVKNTASTTAPTLTSVSVVKDAGYSMSINGSTSKIDCSNYNGLTGDLTISAWVKALSLGEGSAGRIIDNGKLMVKANTTYLSLASDGSTFVSSAANTLVFGKWIHVGILRKSDGKTSFYINAVLSGAADQASGTPATGTTNIIIGNNNAGSATWYGSLGNVQIFSGILTAAEISQIYSSEKSKYL
jgi:hypothetical protein